MEMNNTKAYPLKIGTMSLYCDKMTMESGTLVSVSPTVTGISYITNKCKQPTRLIFTGRMYTPKYPMLFASYSNHLNGTESFDIRYKDMLFKKCIITGAKAVDVGEGYIELTIEASTTALATTLGEVTE